MRRHFVKHYLENWCHFLPTHQKPKGSILLTRPDTSLESFMASIPLVLIQM